MRLSPASLLRLMAATVALLAAHLSAAGQGATACPPVIAAPPASAPSAGERDRGLLWRITRDGHTSHLFGTLHVGKPAWRRLGPRTSAALRASDVLALEIDPADPELMQAMADLRPPKALPEALQQRLQQAYARACMASEALASLHPLLQASTLMVMEARWLGMDPGYAAELLLTAQARAAGRRVLSLETAAQQTQALVPSDEAEALALLEQSLQQLEDRSARRVLERLATAWEQGDLAALEDYERWCDCVADEADRTFLRKLNDERNPGLADGIEAQHRQGRRVFAAVGALHMTGPQGLPQLMAQRGFKVERVPFGR